MLTRALASPNNLRAVGTSENTMDIVFLAVPSEFVDVVFVNRYRPLIMVRDLMDVLIASDGEDQHGQCPLA